MENTIRLSVILPNYQHAHVIPYAIEALLAQEVAPDEIIVVDDASTDESIAVISEFAAKSPAIRLLVNPKNLGAIAALKRGLENARGDYVYFAAADDHVLPGFFEQAVKMLGDYPQAGLYCGDTMLVDGKTSRAVGTRPPVMPRWQAGFVSPGAAARLLKRGDNWIVTGSALFRRTAVLAAGGFDEELGSFADGFLVRKVSLLNGFCYAPQPVAVWCVHAEGVSRSTALNLENAKRALLIAREKIEIDPAFPKWYARRFTDRWRFATARLASEATPRNDGVLIGMGARTALDRATLRLASRVPSQWLGRLAVVASLWVSFRPYRLTDLLRTSIRRRWAQRRNRPSVTRRSPASQQPHIPRQAQVMHDLQKYSDVFADVTPWAGDVPNGYSVDFLGTLTSADFRTMFGVDPRSVGGKHVQTKPPTIAEGEVWFEAVNWVVAAREAKNRYTMITLGANYGAQATGSHRALQLLNPMPSKLVAIEPEPDNCLWTARHFRDNGIDPDDHWILETAVSDNNAPVLFPVGSPGSGSQNCFATNEKDAREHYVRELIKLGNIEAALRNLLLRNTTGLTKSLVPGHNFNAEIKLLSAVTLKDILGPFDFVDYLESDIQQSEIVVFPPFIDLLKKKVRRIHIGTHGREVHWSLHKLFEAAGWEIVFSYEPNAKFETSLGRFETNDGVLTVRNPTL